jgi:tetratricopeptide (TPR) repeat protein
MKTSLNKNYYWGKGLTLTILSTMKNYCSRVGVSLAFSLLSFGLWINPTLAGDPFRLENSRNIGEKTEAAFKALFEEGNYPQAKSYLIEADETEINDPMVCAMRSSLAYTDQDWNTMKTYATKTIHVAEKIKSEDPLRGNLYLAVGNFLEGAYLFKQDGPLAAINKLQLVFNYFDKAESVNSDDPELTLIKGYFNLILAVNLPFSSPEEAIKNLQKYAEPKYLVNRGIALAYRDLKDYDRALEFVDRAIESTPNNPELYYLKGQILRKKGETHEDLSTLNEAIKYYDIALEKIEQLPVEAVQKPLKRERRKAQEKIDHLKASLEKVTPETSPEFSEP